MKTIARALSEIKLLDKKITDRTSKSVFCGVEGTGIRKLENFKPDSDYQAVEDLINERRALKTAIAISNSTTDVIVSGEKMKVIEAIEMKSSIVYRRNLLNKLGSDYRNASKTLDNHNTEVERKLENLLQTLYGKDSTTDEQAKSTADTFRSSNSAKFVEVKGFNIVEKFQQLEEFINNFEAEVDLVLSESNAITTINI